MFQSTNPQSIWNRVARVMRKQGELGTRTRTVDRNGRCCFAGALYTIPERKLVRKKLWARNELQGEEWEDANNILDRFGDYFRRDDTPAYAKLYDPHDSASRDGVGLEEGLKRLAKLLGAEYVPPAK